MRLRELLEAASEKTVAKTWDQLTPEEKSSGVKGRTVWNEKTRKYRTVFDVPVEQAREQGVAEEWSKKYKSSINCSNPKGFSQKAHCASKKK